jgi:3-isopropylmalate dehydrogenase
MMLRYSLDEEDMANKIEAAVRTVLDQGLRTQDIYSEGMRKVGTREMGDAVVSAMRQ